MGLIPERNLPSSPSSSLYSPRAKGSFIKSSLGQANTKKQLLAGQSGMDNSRGLLQLVQSISLVGVSIDHSLQLMLPADSSSFGKFLISDFAMSVKETQVSYFPICSKFNASFLDDFSCTDCGECTLFWNAYIFSRKLAYVYVFKLHEDSLFGY